MSRDRVCCVYKIENSRNGKFYVGGTTNYFQRKRQHISDLNNNKHNCTQMQSDYNEYGRIFFSFLVIEKTTKELLESCEQYWIDNLHPQYNKSRFARKPDERIVFSEKAVISRSETVKKLWQNPEYHQSHCKPRNWKDGIPNRKGVHLSDETKEKLRQANLGERSPRFGKKQPQSFVDKMSKTYPGVIDPEGKVYSPIINMSAFCREHELDNGQMTRLMQGKVVKYRGWTKFIVEGL